MRKPVIICKQCKHYAYEGCWLQKLHKVPQDHSRFRLNGSLTKCQYFVLSSTDRLTGDKINAARLAYGHTLTSMARDIGVDKTTVARWIKRETPLTGLSKEAVLEFINKEKKNVSAHTSG